jgi:hypothetical protein
MNYIIDFVLYVLVVFFFIIAQQHLVDRGLIIEASRSYSDTSHSVGLLPAASGARGGAVG